ncbi:hypothetical protein DFR70_103369 [Nocardia tenerifensis]|uniref:Uncharacterized protein n=1 Tax=Nocardia tenerifensis TaxID=228006 RepID=A0A318K5A2_9NOCA|nr:hypothetical protein [Nocardia tenerifensis]PXX66620.1 hypothetical protein DFR70_103369 [Nocardia tenerifensis]
MSDHEFIVPEESEFLETFGAERVAIPGTIASFVVDIVPDDCNKVELSYDVIARSVRVRWMQDSTLLMDIFREQVNRIAVDRKGIVRISARGGDLSGELTIEVYPVQITDVFLVR